MCDSAGPHLEGVPSPVKLSEGRDIVTLRANTDDITQGSNSLGRDANAEKVLESSRQEFRMPSRRFRFGITKGVGSWTEDCRGGAEGDERVRSAVGLKPVHFRFVTSDPGAINYALDEKRRSQ